jgi:hypothetical protein
MKTSTSLIILGILASGSVWAASSGTLTLSGTVGLVNDLVVTPNGTNNTTLNITGGETGKNVAAVAETSNNGLGYKITVSSVNGGELRLATDAAKKTTYQISYDGGSYFTPTIAGIAAKNVTSLAGLTTNTSQVLVNVVAYPAALVGSYSDTVTFSIAAN